MRPPSPHRNLLFINFKFCNSRPKGLSPYTKQSYCPLQRSGCAQGITASPTPPTPPFFPSIECTPRLRQAFLDGLCILIDSFIAAFQRCCNPIRPFTFVPFNARQQRHQRQYPPTTPPAAPTLCPSSAYLCCSKAKGSCAHTYMQHCTHYTYVWHARHACTARMHAVMHARYVRIIYAWHARTARTHACTKQQQQQQAAARSSRQQQQQAAAGGEEGGKQYHYNSRKDCSNDTSQPTTLPPTTSHHHPTTTSRRRRYPRQHHSPK